MTHIPAMNIIHITALMGHECGDGGSSFVRGVSNRRPQSTGVIMYTQHGNFS